MKEPGEHRQERLGGIQVDERKNAAEKDGDDAGDGAKFKGTTDLVWDFGSQQEFCGGFFVRGIQPGLSRGTHYSE